VARTESLQVLAWKGGTKLREKAFPNLTISEFGNFSLQRIIAAMVLIPNGPLLVLQANSELI
jgi:hypothetical protein